MKPGIASSSSSIVSSASTALSRVSGPRGRSLAFEMFEPLDTAALAPHSSALLQLLGGLRLLEQPSGRKLPQFAVSVLRDFGADIVRAGGRCCRSEEDDPPTALRCAILQPGIDGVAT